VGELNELARHANGRTAQSQRNRHSLRRELVGTKGDANARNGSSRRPVVFRQIAF